MYIKREDVLKALNYHYPHADAMIEAVMRLQPIKGSYVTIEGVNIPVESVRGTVAWDGEKWTFEREKSEPSE